MGIDTILYAVLAVVVVAVPVAIVLGTAALLAVGGVIGCTKCMLAALGSSEPTPAREAVSQVDPRFA
jgi:hypothetical protein